MTFRSLVIDFGQTVTDASENLSSPQSSSILESTGLLSSKYRGPRGHITLLAAVTLCARRTD